MKILKPTIKYIGLINFKQIYTLLSGQMVFNRSFYYMPTINALYCNDNTLYKCFFPAHVFVKCVAFHRFRPAGQDFYFWCYDMKQSYHIKTVVYTYSKRIMPMPLNPAITRKTKPLMNLTVPMYMPCALTAPITLTAVSVADMAPYSAPAADDFVICTLSIRYVTWSS